MKVGLAIRALLLDSSDVTAITNRIFPELAVEGADAPYIVYSVVSNSPSDSKRGTPVDEADIEIFSVASTYSAANDLADKVRAALDRKSKTVSVSGGAVTVQSIQYTNEVTEVSAERSLYVSVQDYTVRITR
tara:strand:+ start:90 stop:485 length:396 start_codon:yes stop_codon:yes gene_type:complete